MRMLLSIATCAFVWISAQAEDVPQQPAADNAAKPAAVCTRRAIIICGLSGDRDHHALFSKTVANVHDGLCKNLGFDPANVLVLFGDAPDAEDPEVVASAHRATREEIEKSVAALRQQTQPQDAVWVIVMGHAHHDGKFAWLNLPGPDMQQFDFAKLFYGLPAMEQVFWMTTPASGAYIKTLTAKGRVVISATDVAGETNETEFPQEFAKLLSSPPTDKDFDVDEDGVITVLDVYVRVTRELAQAYLSREYLSTEHALLDDNGDGSGSELQIDYLTEEQGGRPKRRKSDAAPKITTGDGQLARTIATPFVRLEKPPAPVSE